MRTRAAWSSSPRPGPPLPDARRARAARRSAPVLGRGAQGREELRRRPPPPGRLDHHGALPPDLVTDDPALLGLVLLPPDHYAGSHGEHHSFWGSKGYRVT